jgi:hypothetical protein
LSPGSPSSPSSEGMLAHVNSCLRETVCYIDGVSM